MSYAPRSPLYNTWQRVPDGGDTPWRSAEELRVYSLGVVIEHNTSPVVPGAGSAIFLHAWRPQRGTVGCTGIAERDLVALLDWLDPGEKPVVVQLAGSLFWPVVKKSTSPVDFREPFVGGQGSM